MSASKANLRGYGKGILEFNNEAVTFYVEKGRIKKRKQKVREIAVADIRSAKHSGNELTIVWQGDVLYTDVFLVDIEDAHDYYEDFERLCKAIDKAVRKDEKEKKEKKVEKKLELGTVLNAAIEVVDSLFGLLRCLHGTYALTDSTVEDAIWDRVEECLKSSDENARKLQASDVSELNLDFTKLSSAVRERAPKETIEETYNILVALHDAVSKLASVEDDELERLHPNHRDMKTLIMADYIWNDIMLGAMVNDKDIGKEVDELTARLEKLMIETGLRIHIDAVRDNLNRLIADREKEEIFEEWKGALRKELKEILA